MAGCSILGWLRRELVDIYRNAIMDQLVHFGRPNQCHTIEVYAGEC